MGIKAEKLGKAAVKTLKAAKTVEILGEVLGKGKTLALKVVKKIPKIRVEEVYLGGLRTAEGVEVAEESGKGNLEQRAKELHGTLKEYTQTKITTVVGRVRNPDGSTSYIVGSSEKKASSCTMKRKGE